MPRVKSTKVKHRPVRMNQTRGPFLENGIPSLTFDSSHKISCLDRILVGLFVAHSILERDVMSLQDISLSVRDQALTLGKTLNNRFEKHLEEALNRMFKSRYAVWLPDVFQIAEDNMSFILHPDFKQIIPSLKDQMAASGRFTSVNFPHMVFDVSQYKALCAFFRQLTLSDRLPLRNKLTSRERLLEWRSHSSDASLMHDVERLQNDAQYRAQYRGAVLSLYS